MLTGAVTGIAARVFLIFEMLAADMTGSNFFGPLRMIGATVLGPGALPAEPTIALTIVVLVAPTVHCALSAPSRQASVSFAAVARRSSWPLV